MMTDNDTPTAATLGVSFASVAANVGGTPKERRWKKNLSTASVEEEFYGVEESDVNNFNKNDVDVEEDVEAEEGEEDEKEEQSNVYESVEVWD